MLQRQQAVLLLIREGRLINTCWWYYANTLKCRIPHQ